MSNFIKILENMKDDDEEDDEYIPQIKELKQVEEDNKRYQKQLRKKNKQNEDVFDLNKTWQEMNFFKNEQQQKYNDIQEESKKIAHKVLINSQNLNKNIMVFAGQKYIIDLNGELQPYNYVIDQQKEENLNSQDEVIKNNQQNLNDDLQSPSSSLSVSQIAINDIKQKNIYLKQVLHMIAKKQKVINSIGKSKLDWKQFTKKEKLEKNFEKNRKSGYIDKQKFLQEAKQKQKLNK